MDDRRKTIAAITLIVIVILFVFLVVGVLLTRKMPVVSPVPEEGAIRIIFVSPTLTPTPSAAVTPTPTPKPKATATPKPTPKDTATPTPTKAATSSASTP